MAQSIVLVTGGNNGIGLETCTQFSQQPGIHVIMGSRSVEKGRKAMAEIQKGSIKGTISLVQLDVTSDDSIAAAVKDITEKHGRLDTLINNAGICPTEVNRELFREAFEVNVTSPAMVTRAFAPLLQKSSAPRVIYVSSLLGSIGSRREPSASPFGAEYIAYSASKAALNMLVATDSWVYKDHGFKAFAYCPGLVVSDLANMRQFKVDRGLPGPENSARGLLAIHQGKQDANVAKFLNSASVVDGEATHPW